jgi:hypothetical protein
MASSTRGLILPSLPAQGPPTAKSWLTEFQLAE